MKIRVGKKPLQQGCDRPAPGGKRSAVVEVAAESLTRPSVEQNVAGSCVEACNGTFAGKIGQVGYTAEIDDDAVAAVYRKVNAKVVDMDQAVVNRWRKIAEDAAWTDFAKRSAECERFLKMAKAVA